MNRELVPGLAGWVLAREHGLHLPPSPDASGSPSQDRRWAASHLLPKPQAYLQPVGRRNPWARVSPHPAQLGDKELLLSLGHKEQARRVLSLGSVQRAHPRDRVPIWRPPHPLPQPRPPCHGFWQL